MEIATDLPESTEPCTGLQINLVVEKTSASMKIEVQGFSEFQALWLNKIYRAYEGKLWKKYGNDTKNSQFLCLFCKKPLVKFYTLKAHLNRHLQIFPFKCFACDKMYTSNSGLGQHLKRCKYQHDLTPKEENTGH